MQENTFNRETWFSYTLFFAVVGPLAGTLLIWIGGDFSGGLLDFPFAIAIGYVTGLIPAAFTGFFYGRLTRMLPVRSLWLRSVILIVAGTFIGFFPIFMLSGFGSGGDMVEALAFAGIGGFAGLVCSSLLMLGTVFRVLDLRNNVNEVLEFKVLGLEPLEEKNSRTTRSSHRQGIDRN